MQRGSQPLGVGYTAKVETDKSVWGYNTDIALNTIVVTFFMIFPYGFVFPDLPAYGT